MEAIEEEISELSVQAIGEQYLTFVLDSEEYAVEILKVQEIKSWSRTTPIPCAPDYLLGVINLRGEIVPVIDLRIRFGLDSFKYKPTTAVIVVRTNDGSTEKIAGLVVDEVADVYNLEESKIQGSSDIARSINQDYIKGLAREDKKLIILINLDKIVESSLELMDLDDDDTNES